MVFCDRVERARHEIDGPKLLGLAIAHEIGHVLLNTSAHGNAGIMKSPWLRADLERAEARLAMFTRSERNTIRQQLMPAESTPRVGHFAGAGARVPEDVATQPGTNE